MFKLLFDKGHRNIAYIGGPSRLSTGEVRNEAFKNAAQTHGIIHLIHKIYEVS